MTKTRVLMVEDDPIMRALVGDALRDEGYEVEACADGSEVEHVADRFAPDLAVLDIRLPGGPDGFAVARRLRATRDIPILFLTVSESQEDRRSAFSAGADDYVVKPFDMDELMWRVTAILRRAARRPSGVRQVGDLTIDDSDRTVKRSGWAVSLTQKEYGLLSALADHPGQALSRRELLALVWGISGHAKNLVDVHMSSLRRKLEAHGPRVIHTVRNVGYVLRPVGSSQTEASESPPDNRFT